MDMMIFASISHHCLRGILITIAFGFRDSDPELAVLTEIFFSHKNTPDEIHLTSSGVIISLISVHPNRYRISNFNFCLFYLLIVRNVSKMPFPTFITLIGMQVKHIHSCMRDGTHHGILSLRLFTKTGFGRTIDVTLIFTEFLFLILYHLNIHSKLTCK